MVFVKVDFIISNKIRFIFLTSRGRFLDAGNFRNNLNKSVHFYKVGLALAYTCATAIGILQEFRGDVFYKCNYICKSCIVNLAHFILKYVHADIYMFMYIHIYFN